MFRYAKDITMLNSDRSNWLVITKSIWRSLDKEICIVLYTPLRYESLNKFILRIEEAQTLIFDIAKDQQKATKKEKLSSRDKALYL